MRIKGLPRIKLDVRDQPLPSREHLTGIRIVHKARGTEVHLSFAIGEAPAGVDAEGKAQDSLRDGTLLPTGNGTGAN